MTMPEPAAEPRIGAIAPADRVLLLPHCLRPSETCPGKHSKEGLVCPEDCSLPCAIRVLREAALEYGYKGVCVAPGGSMVLRFVEQMAPLAIVAVACEKELELGVTGVKELVAAHRISMPVVEVVPLTKEGCVDTEVDIEEALRTLNSFASASPPPSSHPVQNSSSGAST